MVAFVAGPLTSAALNTAFNAYTLNAQTGSTYQYVLTDNGGMVVASHASPVITIPTNATVAFPTGTKIETLYTGSGYATLVAAGGATLSGATIIPPNCRAVILKQATNAWYAQIVGFTPGLNYITSATAATAATLSVDGCFTALYDNYLLLWSGIGSVDTYMSMRLRVAAADNSAASYDRQALEWQSTTVTAARTTGATEWTRVGGNTTTLRNTTRLEVYGPALAEPTSMQTTTAYNSGGGYGLQTSAGHTASTAFDGFTLYPTSGTITGTVRVYGYRNA